MTKYNFYNENLKKRFLEEKPTQTQNFYGYVLSKACNMEELLQKDIHDFTLNELITLRQSYNNRSFTVVLSIKSVLTQYIDFCIEQGYVKSKINYLKGVGGKEDIIKYVDNIAKNKKFISEEELYEIENLCYNAQDAVIFNLLFNGVKGENSEELINLKILDCDFTNNTLILTKMNGDSRTIKVSDRTMELIKDAINQDKYFKNNGEECAAKAQTWNIIETEYVVRTAGKTADKAKPSNIISRINKIKTFWGNPYLTVTSIWYSGMLNYANKIKEDKGELFREDYENINKVFSYDPRYWYLTKVRLSEYLSNG
jgi:integrase